MITAEAITATTCIPPVSCADTGAATSSWIDVSAYKGNIEFVIINGALTGSYVGKLRSATSSGGANAADIAGATHGSVSSNGGKNVISVPATIAKYMQYIATITTGPVLLSVVILGNTGQAG